MVAFVVAKNIRALLSIVSGQGFRAETQCSGAQIGCSLSLGNNVASGSSYRLKTIRNAKRELRSRV